MHEVCNGSTAKLESVMTALVREFETELSSTVVGKRLCEVVRDPASIALQEHVFKNIHDVLISLATTRLDRNDKVSLPIRVVTACS
jgi:hypothetical protein